MSVRFLDNRGSFSAADFNDRLADAIHDARRAGVRDDKAASVPLLRAIDSAVADRGIAKVRQRIAGADALSSGTPSELLVHEVERIMERPYPALDGFDLIPEFTPRTPVGARESRYYSMDVSGEVARYRAGEQIPTVSLDIADEVRPVAHYVSVVEADLFEEQAGAFSAIAPTAEMAIARNRDVVHLQAANRRVWFGDAAGTAEEIYGVMTHPGIAEAAAASSWLDAGTSGQAVVQQYGDLATLLSVESNGIADVDTCAMDLKLYRGLASKTYAATGGGQQSVLQLLEQMFPTITIRPSHSLIEQGPFGGHALVFFDSRDNLALGRDLVRGPTLLPVERRGFSRYWYMYHTDAGVKSFMRMKVLRADVPLAS